jgi:hypothetical protein
VENPATNLLLAAPGLLVGEHHIADRQALAGAEVEQFPARAERELHLGLVEDHPVGPGRGLVDHEPAADRVVRLLEHRRSGVFVGRERHAVGVRREAAPPVHDQVLVEVERHRVRAGQSQDPLLA